jgi:hypothetical protein
VQHITTEGIEKGENAMEILTESGCNTDGCVDGCFPACVLPVQSSFAFGATGGIVVVMVVGADTVQA